MNFMDFLHLALDRDDFVIVGLWSAVLLASLALLGAAWLVRLLTRFWLGQGPRWWPRYK